MQSFLVSALLLLLLVRPSCTYKKDVLDLRMPDIVPTLADSYLCHAFTIPNNETWYITSIGPILVDPEAVHHIIVLTCPSIASNLPVWGCGGMIDPEAFPEGEPCNEPVDVLMYDWTKGVDAYRFPKGVGFKVGGDGDTRNLILEVHYSDVSRFNESFRDSSGLKIAFTRERTPMLAGLTSAAADGEILPGRLENIESRCTVNISEDASLRVFSYLVHTHDLGLLVTAYRERDGNSTEIARRSPQLPKSFTPTDVQLQDGDIVFLRCVMYNFKERIVRTGPTHHHEMCIIRLLYYAENGESVPTFDCVLMDDPTDDPVDDPADGLMDDHVDDPVDPTD